MNWIASKILEILIKKAKKHRSEAYINNKPFEVIVAYDAQIRSYEDALMFLKYK